MRAFGLIASLTAGCGFAPGTGDDDDPSIDASGDPDAPAVDAMDALPIVIEAEDHTSLTSPQSHDWIAQTTVPQHSGASYMFLAGGDGSPCTSMITTCGASMVFDVTIADPGTYYFHARMWADGSATDSVWVGIDDVPADAVDVAEDSSWHWSQSATTFAVTPGPHTLHVWHREGGAAVDTIAFTSDPAPP